MKIVQSFRESLSRRTVLEAKRRSIVIFSFHTIHFICVIALDECYWIQHKNTRPVVLTTDWNELLWTSEVTEYLFIWQNFNIAYFGSE